MSPTQQRVIHVQAIKHGSILNRGPPAERVRLHLPTFFRRGQAHRAIQIGEIKHSTMPIYEPPPDFSMCWLHAQ